MNIYLYIFKISTPIFLFLSLLFFFPFIFSCKELFTSFTFKSFNGSYPFGVHLFYLQKFQWSLLFWCWILGWIVISTHCHPTSLSRPNAWRDKIAFLCYGFLLAICCGDANYSFSPFMQGRGLSISKSK